MTSFSLLEDGITALKPPGSVTGLEEARGQFHHFPEGVSISCLSEQMLLISTSLPDHCGPLIVVGLSTLEGPSKIFCFILIHHLIRVFSKRESPKLCKLWPQKPLEAPSCT